MTVDEMIGWGSAALLLPTFGIQTLRQWRARHDPAPGSALWFFILAFAGTGGQVVYSWLVGNRVYLALNAILVVTNGVGLGVAIHRWRIARAGAPLRGRHGAPSASRGESRHEEPPGERPSTVSSTAAADSDMHGPLWQGWCRRPDATFVAETGNDGGALRVYLLPDPADLAGSGPSER